MLVRCLSNEASGLSEEFLESLGVDRTYRLGVTIGREYVVYALLIDGSRIFYYICADAGDTFPIWFPSPLFDVIDNRVSSQWVFRGYSASPPRDVFAIFAFPEWTNDPTFYDRLSDADEAAVVTFLNYRRLMDAEALSATTSTPLR